jgi:hypothetical protein
MGFFSWECKGCGKSILSEYAVNDGEDFGWMTQAVWLRPNGTVVIGEYDGYGRIDDTEIEYEPDEPELWHEDCFDLAGRPAYSGPSENASDQGYFIDPAEYQGSKPSGG